MARPSIDECLKETTELFREGTLPRVLAAVFLARDCEIPAAQWSFMNRVRIAKRGHVDARGYQQWKSVGRQVKKGQRASYIFAPVVKRLEAEEKTEASTEEAPKERLVGWRPIPVFGQSQTTGEPLSESAQSFLEALPLLEVAESWEIGVYAEAGKSLAELAGARGLYRPDEGTISLGVENLATWTHELVHVAENRLGQLGPSREEEAEIVAELGGTVLLRCLGLERDADLGGAWRYIQSYARRLKLDPNRAVARLVDRVGAAVGLILETHDRIVGERTESAA